MNEKGTLTILDREHFVLELPHGYRHTKEMAGIMNDRIKEWLQTGGVLVLDFPVEVISKPQEQAVIQMNQKPEIDHEQTVELFNRLYRQAARKRQV